MKDLLRGLGVSRPDIVAEQLARLRAGAMAVASVTSTEPLEDAFTDAWAAPIDRTI